MTALPHNTDIPAAEQPDSNWRSFSQVIASLKAQIDAARDARDEAAAAQAHEELTDAEHAQRVTETVRRLSDG